MHIYTYALKKCYIIGLFSLKHIGQGSTNTQFTGKWCKLLCQSTQQRQFVSSKQKRSILAFSYNKLC